MVLSLIEFFLTIFIGICGPMQVQLPERAGRSVLEISDFYVLILSQFCERPYVIEDAHATGRMSGVEISNPMTNCFKNPMTNLITALQKNFTSVVLTFSLKLP